MPANFFSDNRQGLVPYFEAEGTENNTSPGDTFDVLTEEDMPAGLWAVRVSAFALSDEQRVTVRIRQRNQLNTIPFFLGRDVLGPARKVFGHVEKKGRNLTVELERPTQDTDESDLHFLVAVVSRGGGIEVTS